MSLRWYFHAVRAANAFGFTWHWRCDSPDGSTAGSRLPFDYYYDCVEDARRQGYRGPLPPGPKVALSRLPGHSGRSRGRKHGVLKVCIQDLQQSRTGGASGRREGRTCRNHEEDRPLRSLG